MARSLEIPAVGSNIHRAEGEPDARQIPAVCADTLSVKSCRQEVRQESRDFSLTKLPKNRGTFLSRVQK